MLGEAIMNGVRTVAGIFLIIGWIAVVVGGLLTLGILFSLMATMRGNLNALMLMGSLTPLFMAVAASLSPFFLWAILRALIEIYDVQVALLNAATTAARSSVPGAPTLTSSPLQAAPASVLARPPLGSGNAWQSSGECRSCGFENPDGRQVCQRCHARL
jgi:hypothetical protein